MNQKTVYQLDRANFYAGHTVADESPLEPGVYHIPARCVEAAPPAEWPENKWPRWNGSHWVLVNKPVPAQPADEVETDPLAKLRAFLNNNPDVAALLSSANNGGDNV